MWLYVHQEGITQRPKGLFRSQLLLLLLLLLCRAGADSKYMYTVPSTSIQAYMHQLNGSALVQVMACCLFSAKPLPELILTYCQLNRQEHFSEIHTEEQHFSLVKMHFENVICEVSATVSGGDKITITNYTHHQTSNISFTWVGSKSVDHSDVVGASPISAAPTTSSFST